MRTILDVRRVRFLEDRSLGGLLVFDALPVAAQVFRPDAPDEAVEVPVAPVDAAVIETVDFPSGAWLAMQVAALADADPEALMIKLAGLVEADPFAARDLAASWRARAAAPATADGSFWVPGTLVLGAYDFATERFPGQRVTLGLADVDGIEGPLMQRLRFRLPADAFNIALPPDEARAWQADTKLVGKSLPFRALARLSGLEDASEDRFVVRLDILALDVLRPDAAVSLREPDGIVWQAAAPAVWPERVPAEAAEPQAPAAPSTPVPAASDVAGLRLGLGGDAFRAEARALFDGAAPITLSSRNADPAETWGTVSGFTDAGIGQTVLAVHPPGRPDGPAIALMRRLSLPPGAATPEALKLSLEAKYGAEKTEAGDFAIFWGLPPDPAAQTACAPFRTGAERAPDLMIDPSAQVEVGSSVSQPGIWGSILSWPPDATSSPAVAALDSSAFAQCSPVVTAMISEDASGGLALVVWIFDMGAMARVLADPAFAPPAAKPAAIKL
jgi:hypothetical protein